MSSKTQHLGLNGKPDKEELTVLQAYIRGNSTGMIAADTGTTSNSVLETGYRAAAKYGMKSVMGGCIAALVAGDIVPGDLELRHPVTLEEEAVIHAFTIGQTVRALSETHRAGRTRIKDASSDLSRRHGGANSFQIVGAAFKAGVFDEDELLKSVRAQEKNRAASGRRGERHPENRAFQNQYLSLAVRGMESTLGLDDGRRAAVEQKLSERFGTESRVRQALLATAEGAITPVVAGRLNGLHPRMLQALTILASEGNPGPRLVEAGFVAPVMQSLLKKTADSLLLPYATASYVALAAYEHGLLPDIGGIKPRNGGVNRTSSCTPAPQPAGIEPLMVDSFRLG